MKLFEHRSRIAALALLVGAIAAAQSFVVAPLAHIYSERAAKIALLSARAGRISNQESSGPGYERSLAAIEHSGKAAAIFWPGTTDAIAAAGLQEKMRATLQQAGATIDQTEALAPTTEGELHRIGLKVQFSADIDQAEHLVHAVESMTPSLVVDRLAVHALNSPRPDTAELGVELRVFGYAAPRKGPAA
jgi:general secretion pathway protein M